LDILARALRVALNAAAALRWKIIEVLAEASPNYGGGQITIAGGDDANVDVDELRSPDSVKFPFLQHPQERNLHFRRQIAQFI
jgi:hypothetical protein